MGVASLFRQPPSRGWGSPAASRAPPCPGATGAALPALDRMSRRAWWPHASFRRARIRIICYMLSKAKAQEGKV